MLKPPAPTPPELPPDYYLRNFRQLLQVVQHRYADLLNPAELDFCRRFFAASQDAQCLYVRLYTRSKSRFRASKLSYPEISDLGAAAHELESLHLLQISPSVDPEHLLPLYSKPELLRLFPLKGATKLKRAELDQQLLTQDTTALCKQLAQADTYYAVNDEEHWPVFKLCFFGNLYQDLSEFVLRDLAIFQFEPYTLDSATRQFADRQQLEQHLLYGACFDALEQARSEGVQSMLALSAQLPTPQPHDHTLIRRVERLKNHIARDLERMKATDEALSLYRQSEQPPARERSARILMSQQQVDESLAVCRQILDDPKDEAEAVFAQQFAQRHAARHARHWPAVEKHKPPEQHLMLTRQRSVELATCEHLSRDGQCFYVENALFSSVLGLALWSAVFAPLRGAFSHPFQHRPHDYYDPDFYRRRKDLIDSTLARQLNDPDGFKATLLDTYQHKYGTANPLVFWSAIDEPLLELALQRIPASHWQLIFRRLLSDLRNHRNGLPDLLYFPAEGHYQLVEVKGPGDRLQDNQRRWMHFFAQHGFPHWVAQVSWQTNADD